MLPENPTKVAIFANEHVLYLTVYLSLGRKMLKYPPHKKPPVDIWSCNIFL